MNSLEYIKLNEVDLDDLLRLLNNQKVRKHLVEHALFDRETLVQWIDDKNKVDASPGCKVRAIMSNSRLAGWCGIQLEKENYEIAIVLHDECWGIGKSVFQEVMDWAKAFGHEEVFIHFPRTRPEYRFLRKISKQVTKSEIFGSEFTTYQLSVK